MSHAIVNENWSVLSSEWNDFYPKSAKPDFIVRAPGRVNLIGEHVDHQAYSVCPCAIEQSIGVAVSFELKTDDNASLELKSRNSNEYTDLLYKDLKDIKVDSKNKIWGNYVCAAYLGYCEFLFNGRIASKVGLEIEPSTGLTDSQISSLETSSSEEDSLLKFSPTNYSIKFLIDGNLPAAAGLSSSGALVVATILACANLGPNPPPPVTLADLCAKAENYVGVASGGMDQAAILLSVKDSATLIHFKPMKTLNVQLPKGGAIVIANTCRTSPKAKMAAKMYNKRVFELKAACWFLCDQKDPQRAASMTDEEFLNLQLREVVRDWYSTSEEDFALRLSTLLPEKVFNKAEILEILPESKRLLLLEKKCGMDVWDLNDDFWLYRRVRHVLTEAERVASFAKIAQNPSGDDETDLAKLGVLMDGSGASLHHDFDCSCSEILEVCAIAKKYGAYGSRLTGAGWGGCTVSLVPESKVESLIEGLKKEYYEPLIEGSRKADPPLEALPSKMEELERVVFATTPSNGATIIR